MAVETMILRFRDLSTPIGDTIQLHKDIISVKGYVWWGWWKKAGESVPDQAFRDLSRVIVDNGSLSIFLFDTGTLSLYRGKLDEIKWDNLHHHIPSPENDATPDYYQSTEYISWFKLSIIEDGILPENELKNWSYERVEELFETRKSIFNDFYGKQVFSFEELKHQERTIWFIRQNRPSDPIREILLYDTSRVTPSNFPTPVIDSRETKILWLSDLHFSRDKHRFPIESNHIRDNLSDAIRKDLERQDIRDLAGVFISGDLTWRGSQADFSLVLDFIRKIESWATLVPNQFVICPGNHDIKFSDRPWAKDEVVRKSSDEARRNFGKFYEDFFSVKANKFLCSGRRFILGMGLVVEIVSINSSILDQKEGLFQGHGFVGDEQLQLVAEGMGWTNSDSFALRPFRIVMLHHHIVPVLHRELPVAEQQSSIVYDAGALCRWIVEQNINLVVHGHMHHATAVREARSLDLMEPMTSWHEFTIASMGSSGVVPEYLGSENHNSYGLLDFRRDNLNVKVRAISPTGDIDAPQQTLLDFSVPYHR